MRIISRIGLILVIITGFSAGFMLEPEYREKPTKRFYYSSVEEVSSYTLKIKISRNIKTSSFALTPRKH